MKKLLSICLSAILLFSVAVVPASANNGEKTMHTLEQAMAYWEEELGCEIPTRTLYFYFRDDWKFESNDYYDVSVGLESCQPAVYWWGLDVSCHPDYYPPYNGNGWPGYILTEEVAPNVYKAEIPVDVDIVVWNNGVDSGVDPRDPVRSEARQSENMPIGYDDCDSYGFYPDGIPKDNFDNMIYVIDENNWPHSSPNNSIGPYYGAWFYYYGNGEYGTAPTKEEAGNMICRDGEFPGATLDVKPKLIVENEELSSGETTTLTIENQGSTEAVYSSSNPDVAKVNKNGKVTALSKGETTITATVGDTKLTCRIKVKNNPKLVNSNGEKVKAVTIKKGKKAILLLQGKAESIKNIYENSKKAKIVSGKNAKKIKIKGLKKGTSKVTVKVNNVKNITVKVKVV